MRRSPLSDHPYCFCGPCRERYYSSSGKDLLVDSKSEEGMERIHQWRQEASRSSIEYLRERVLKIRRTLRIVSRARPQWRWSGEDAATGIDPPYCLDWNDWLDAGIVETLLIDHDNETEPDLFRTRLVSDLASLHDEAFLMPTVQLRKVRELELPLEAIARHPVSGFLAEFTSPMTPEDALYIREHYLSEPAQSPDHTPLLSVAFLLHRIQARHTDNHLISDFLRDFLRLVERQLHDRPLFDSIQLILQNLSGLQNSIRRGKLGDYNISESTMRDLSLARRILRLAMLDAYA